MLPPSRDLPGGWAHGPRRASWWRWRPEWSRRTLGGNTLAPGGPAWETNNTPANSHASCSSQSSSSTSSRPHQCRLWPGLPCEAQHHHHQSIPLAQAISCLRQSGPAVRNRSESEVSVRGRSIWDISKAPRFLTAATGRSSTSCPCRRRTTDPSPDRPGPVPSLDPGTLPKQRTATARAPPSEPRPWVLD